VVLSLVLHRFPECLNIAEVFKPATGAFVLDERGASDKGNVYVAHSTYAPIIPGIGEDKTADVGENINPTGRDSDLDHHIRLTKIIWRNLKRANRGAKFEQGCPDALRIICTSINPNVNIASSPWDAMHRQRLGTHHEEPRMGSEQGSDKIQEIRFHDYRG